MRGHARSSARPSTRSPTCGGCGRSGSACRWPMPSTWPTCSSGPGLRALRCRRARRRPSAPRRCGACGRWRSTACSPSTCSTRVLDLPQVDTVLFLRPTQSSTVFLQQLGRGLRRARGKAVLTVLDFIGQHRREFRFDVRYRALTGGSRRALLDDIEHGFPFLPSGSQLVLDRVARTIVVENVRQQLRPGIRAVVADLRSRGDLLLADFLRDSGRDLADVYAQRRSWTGLRREAGLPAPPAGPGGEVAAGPYVRVRPGRRSRAGKGLHAGSPIRPARTTTS